MISEAALTGKPIYVANILPKRKDKRFQKFRKLFKDLNIIKNVDNVKGMLREIRLVRFCKVTLELTSNFFFI